LGAVGPEFKYFENYMNPGFNIWVDAEEYVRDIAGVRAQCGETTFAEAWEAGRALGLAGAIRDALAVKTGGKPSD
jgi:hypothetical protein